ncbi:hypothetical protein SKAU_G00381300 [Synaphobranchus kaupii]|uniref:Uncharacterized protein n=1 Tax=Synaphobranchus kaupii TaxID=118154 RepID=A0A9Q1EDP8_SYNKA|nr:hypothetical protein SKAU_G00381300 [Synaphobranchus kaupii]
MCRPLLPLMLITGALLISTEGQEDYHRLSAIYKNIVDQAIQHCNQNPLRNCKQPGAQHMNFFRFLHRTRKHNPFYIELHLKATDCSSSWKTTHQDDCKFISQEPSINCAFCKKHETDLHCTTQRRTAEQERVEFRNNCQLPGSNHPASA